ncbi:MAG: DUF2252 domain-containing protein [Flavobacteriales bacterium]|nr:DUF2252 domain-containing protein [Flavobacteriales bacterium]
MSDHFEKYITKGKSLRTKFARATLAQWKEPKGRLPVMDQIRASDQDRLPKLVPVRHDRMKESPFVFYRATAGIMASDLAGVSTGLYVQAIGDCHLMNFGGFATPERTLVFDANDFDETHPAPWEWDLKRLAASFVLAGRAGGLEAKEAEGVAFELGAAYRDAVRDFAEMSMLDLWYMKFDLRGLVQRARSNKAKKVLQDAIDEAEKNTHVKTFYKLTESNLGRFEIREQKPLVYHPFDMKKDMAMILRFMDEYKRTLQPDRRILFERYKVVDVALKVVGVGSVGTRCYVVLLMNDREEPLFIQVKEARRSVLAPFTTAEAFSHEGRRIVEGQRLVQAASDMFLGWSTGPLGRHFYLRQLRDQKMALDVDRFDEELLTSYARLCGNILARAHVRTGKGAVLAGYIGGSDAVPEAIARFGMLYADQTEKDHAEFTRALRHKAPSRLPKERKLRRKVKAMRKEVAARSSRKKTPGSKR